MFYLWYIKCFIVNMLQTTIKSLKKMNIEAVNKIPETIRVIPDRLKTKKMCEHSVKKLHFLIRHVPDQYKTQ